MHRSGHITVCIKLRDHKWLALPMIYLCHSLRSFIQTLKEQIYRCHCIAVPAFFAYIKRPSVMKSQITVIGPDICNIKGFLKLLLILYRRILSLQISYSSTTKYQRDLRCLFLHDLCKAYKKLSDLLVGKTLIVGKPVTGTLMVDTQTHSAKGLQLLCDLTEIFILQRTVNGQRQSNILSMAADIPHLLKRLSLRVPIKTSTIWKIIIIRIIPLKMNLHIFTCHTDPLRPFLVLWIISIHNTNISVRSSQSI